MSAEIRYPENLRSDNALIQIVDVFRSFGSDITHVKTPTDSRASYIAELRIYNHDRTSFITLTSTEYNGLKQLSLFHLEQLGITSAVDYVSKLLKYYG
jgi:ribosome-binding ATPase YchF (GTP1/OBG family)